MLRNYLKVAFRTLHREKGYAAINVFGLAVGLAACLLMALYVRHELSYDRFHEKADRLFRVLYVSEQDDGSEQLSAQQPRPLAPALAEEFPQIERVAQINRAPQPSAVRQAGATFREEITFADSTFFEMFSFPLAQGDPAHVLDRPGAAVLSAEAAQKYFGDENPVAQRLEVRLDDTFYDVTVTGVAQPLPPNSSLSFDVLLSHASGAAYAETFAAANWGTRSPRLYLELTSKETATDLEAQLPSFLQRIVPPERRSGKRGLRLQPITEVHHATAVRGSLAPALDPVYVRILGGVALFVLLIACINFTTLAVGRSARRAREVGMRKVLGAVRGQLMRQFWGEALLMSAGAAVLGLGIARAVLPAFEALVGKELALRSVATPLVLAALVGGLLLVALVAGAYPAFYLSKFRPAEVLTGRFRPGGGRTRLRRGLVVLQLALAGSFLVVTLVMARQMQFLQERDLGFEQEQVVRLPVPMQEGRAVEQRLKQQLAGAPSVQSVAGSWNRLGGGEGVGFDAGPPADVGTGKIEAAEFAVSPDAFETLGLNVVRGRSLPDEPPRRDGPSVLVNEAFVEAAGWGDPLGQTVSVPAVGPKNARVVGVVENFHFEALRKEIQPLLMRVAPYFTTLYVRTAPGQTRAALDRIEAAWQEAAPALPFAFTFMDEAVEQQYRAERRWARTVTGAAGLALFITVTGLIGLAALSTQRRTREIAIRKALGASAASVVRLISTDFLKLVALGFALAVPLSWWAARRWLERFAYHAELGPWLFAAGGALLLLVAAAATGGLAWRAARANPADALRDE
jgi:putative ABC transport system permease protein